MESKSYGPILWSSHIDRGEIWVNGEVQNRELYHYPLVATNYVVKPRECQAACEAETGGKKLKGP